jgi:predicted phage terminase large subunit-like protein
MNALPEQVSVDQTVTAARESLPCYSILQFPRFEFAAHTRAIVDHLEAVECGEIRRLMIFMPPRHGKSLIATQMFPAWYLGRHPDRFVISASYSQDLSDDFGRKVRNLVSDPLHRAVFPTCMLSDDSSSMRRFNTTIGGAYYAVGRGGPITGRGAHLLIIDDLLKDAEEAQSETIRRALHEWYSSVAYTRLQPGAAIVLIATRWHEDDLAGWLLREHDDEGWTVLSMPAIAERDESWRKEGEPLWPSHFPLQTLELNKSAIGSAAWASLYQQRPAAAEGAIFKREWWQHYTDQPTAGRIAQSWDTSFGKNTQGDYSVCTTWAATNNGYYLLNVWRARVDFPALKAQLVSQAGFWHPSAILVEDTASGQSLIQELRTTNLPILPIKADSDKVSRASAVTPLIESGRVFLPQSTGWLQDFIDELAAFPNGAHDDSVDSLTQALNYLRRNSMGGSMYVVRGGTLRGPDAAQCWGSDASDRRFPEAPEDPKEWFSGGILHKVL